MAIFHTIYVSAATGSSVNTSFSMVGAGPSSDYGYHISIWNECPSRIAVAIATTMPTSTTQDQIYIPANAATAKDHNSGKYFVSSGHNIYLRTAQTSIVSGACWIEFY